MGGTWQLPQLCRFAGVAFTIVIELGMPHISEGWQEELAGVVYGETHWQARGVICGEDRRNRTNPYSVKASLVIFIMVRSTELMHHNI